MATVIAPAQSQFARFVVADLKGKEHAHAFRMSLVSAAIEEALKGNFNPIREAREHAIGKSRKAAAYQAGFTAALAAAAAFYPPTTDGSPYAGKGAGGILKVEYTGRLDAASNAPAREAIAMQTGIIAAAFERGYTEHDAKAAAEAKAKAAENKAKKEAKAAAEQQDAPEPVPASVEMDVSDIIDHAVAAIQQGLVTGDEVTILRAALASYDALQLAGAVEVTAPVEGEQVAA